MLEAISNVINNIPGDENSDTFMQDGLLHCNKCREPKQMFLNIFGGQQIVHIMCDCEKKEEQERQLKFRTTLNDEEIERSRCIAMNSPEFYKHVFANDSGQQPAMKKIRKYANDFKTNYERNTGLLLYGPCESGKTFAAECIANRAVDLGYPVLVTNFGKIAEEIMACPFDERAAYYSCLSKYPLLVIDDLGRERETDYMMEVIQRVIDERDRSGKPMIISTNFSPDEVNRPKNDNWARVFSRIKRTCYPILFEGGFFRTEQFKKNKSEMDKYFSDCE